MATGKAYTGQKYLVVECTIAHATVAAGSQQYAYAAGLTGYKCISAIYEISGSDVSSVAILSSPIYNPNANQWVARIYNPTTTSIYVGGVVKFLFVPATNLS